MIIATALNAPKGITANAIEKAIRAVAAPRGPREPKRFILVTVHKDGVQTNQSGCTCRIQLQRDERQAEIKDPGAFMADFRRHLARLTEVPEARITVLVEVGDFRVLRA